MTARPAPLIDGLAGLSRGQALARLTAAFADAGIDTPETDARLLLAHALDITRLTLATERDAIISAIDAARIAAAARRRLSHEPVSRIIGERWFYGRPFKITPATLDPRPESETLIEAALALVRESGLAPRDIRLLDIGTGTGCLALTLLAELPGATGIGTDISDAALAVAVENGRRLAEASPLTIDWRCGAGLGPVSGQTFNLIVSNPPYISHAVLARLDPDVRQFDPHLALDGGPDGLTVYRRLIAPLPSYLPTGWVVFEVGSSQAAAVAELLRTAFAPVPMDIRTFADLAGVQRCVAASPRTTN